MGDFSRNTFDPNKNYVGVRLQQGVPLLDADWNELDDVIRNEIYSGLDHAFPDGIESGTNDLRISPTSPAPTNDLMMAGGTMLVSGRPLRVPTTILYSAQPWANPTRAAQDGVTVIPPLTPPSANRTDIVYLDVWEREVRGTEDTNLINPAIGVETCVRLKRESAFRVAEGTQTLPATPAGHSFVPLALLNRLAGQGNITVQQIEDGRPRLFSTRGTRSISFAPTFLAWGTTVNPWLLDGATMVATTSVKSGAGLLPLVLPEGATMLSLRVQGATGEVYFIFHRKQQASVSEQLVNQGPIASPIGTPTTFDLLFPISNTNRMNIVDNSRFCYFLTILNGNTNLATSITRITINYRY